MFNMSTPIARFIVTCCVLLRITTLLDGCGTVPSAIITLQPAPTPTLSGEQATATQASIATYVANLAATQTAGPTATAIAVATTTARRQPWNVAYGKPVTTAQICQTEDRFSFGWRTYFPLTYLNDGDEATSACLRLTEIEPIGTGGWTVFTVELGSSYTITTVEFRGLKHETIDYTYLCQAKEINFLDATGNVIEIGSTVGSGTPENGHYVNYLFTFKQPQRQNKITVKIYGRDTGENIRIGDLLINGTP